MTYRPVFRIVHLDDWCAAPANGDWQRLAADLASEISGASAELATPEEACLPIERYLAERSARGPARPAERYAGTRRVVHIDRPGCDLPPMRVHFARRRELVDDQPFARVARLEANLERLLVELETEVARLVGASHEALGSAPTE